MFAEDFYTSNAGKKKTNMGHNKPPNFQYTA